MVVVMEVVMAEGEVMEASAEVMVTEASAEVITVVAWVTWDTTRGVSAWVIITPAVLITVAFNMADSTMAVIRTAELTDNQEAVVVPLFSLRDVFLF